MSILPLNSDCWSLIILQFHDNPHTLFNLLLVSKSFFLAVVPILYHDPLGANPSKKAPISSFTPLKINERRSTLDRIFSPWSQSRLEYSIARCSGYLDHLSDEKSTPEWWKQYHFYEKPTIDYYQFVRYMPVRPMRLFRMPSGSFLSDKKNDLIEVLSEDENHDIGEQDSFLPTNLQLHALPSHVRSLPKLAKDRNAFKNHVRFHGSKLTRLEVPSRDCQWLANNIFLLSSLTEVRFERIESERMFAYVSKFLNNHQARFGNLIQKVDMDGQSFYFEKFLKLQECLTKGPKKIQIDGRVSNGNAVQKVLDLSSLPICNAEWVKFTGAKDANLYSADELSLFLQNCLKLKTLILVDCEATVLNWVRNEFLEQQEATMQRNNSGKWWKKNLTRVEKLYLHKVPLSTINCGLFGFHDSLEAISIDGYIHTDDENDHNQITFSFPMLNLTSFRAIDHEIDITSLSSFAPNLTSLEISAIGFDQEALAPSKLWKAPRGLRKLFLQGLAADSLDLTSIGALVDLEHLTLRSYLFDHDHDDVPFLRADTSKWWLSRLKQVALEGKMALAFHGCLLTIAPNLESFLSRAHNNGSVNFDVFSFNTVHSVIESSHAKYYSNLKYLQLVGWNVDKVDRQDFSNLFGQYGGKFPNLKTLVLGMKFDMLPLVHKLLTEAEVVRLTAKSEYLESLGRALQERLLTSSVVTSFVDLRAIAQVFLKANQVTDRNIQDQRRCCLETVMVTCTGTGGLDDKKAREMALEKWKPDILWRNRQACGRMLFRYEDEYYVRKAGGSTL